MPVIADLLSFPGLCCSRVELHYRSPCERYWNPDTIYQKGVLLGTIGVSRNITDHKKADEALRLSEEKLLYYQPIVDLTDGGIPAAA